MFKIFVVEDNANFKKLTSTILRQNGYNPIEASDELDAPSKLDSHHADLILLDLMMPNIDGYEFTRALRESGNNIPILMITAKDAIQDKR